MQRLLIVCLLAVSGCPTPPPAPPKDLAAAACIPDLAFKSICGKPCDTESNTFGIGKFCQTADDCRAPVGNADWAATICSTMLSAVDPTADVPVFFCTKICTVDPATTPIADPAECGPNSLCQCFRTSAGALIGCGCTPLSCGTLLPGG